jgi:hypothetical protein
MADFDALNALLAAPASANAGARVDPSVQAQRDAIGARIRQQELAKARASGDQASAGAVSRELQRMGAPEQAPPAAPDRFDAIANLLSQPSSPGRQQERTPAPVAPPPQSQSDRPARRDPYVVEKGALETAANTLTGIGSSIVGGLKGLGVTARGVYNGQSLSDAAVAGGQAVTDYQQAHTYQPETPGGIAGVEAMQHPANPLTWPGHAGEYVGSRLAEATGSPALGVLANAATSFIGPGVALKGAGAATGASLRLIRNADTPAALIQPRVEPTMGAVAAAPAAVDAPQAAVTSPVVPQAVAAQPLAPLPPITPAPRPLIQPAPAAVPPAPLIRLPAPGSAQPIPAAPAYPTMVAERAGPTISAVGEVGQVPELSATKTLPASEQARRAAILQEVGITDARKSALSGNAKDAATENQWAKKDGPAGDLMKARLDAEKAAITSHAEGLARQTGGTFGVDQADVMTRGATVATALDSLKDWYNTRTSALYKIADERAGGVPTQLDRFRTVLGDDAEMTNSDRVHLRVAVNAYAKKLSLIGDDGSVFSTAQQAETLRKYLNEQWSPQNSKWVGKLKDALDEDVTSAAGQDIYSEARAMRAERGAKLDNPNGIAKIADVSGPEGINRTVPVEKIPNAITTMPVDQMRHVVRTLKEMPPELQAQGQSALNEIRAQFATRIHELGSKQVGQWNAKGVREYLKANSERLGSVFSPEEMQRFGTLREAGDILEKSQAYPGAHVQGHNLVQAATSRALEAGGLGLGTMVGGPVGGGAGAFMGNRLANRLATQSELKAAQGRFVNLSDFLNTGK